MPQGAAYGDRNKGTGSWRGGNPTSGGGTAAAALTDAGQRREKGPSAFGGGQTAESKARSGIRLNEPGKSTGSGGATDTSAPTFTRTAPPQELSPMAAKAAFTPPSGDDTYDNTGRLKTMGTSPYVNDPSEGQIAGLVTTAMPVVGTLNAIGGAISNLVRGRGFGATYDGGLVGQAVDDENGVSPGAITGNVGNRVASSTNSRGDNDTRLMDRASAAARSELDGSDSSGATGDVTTGGDDGGAEFSSVKLADRRRPYDDLSAVDLLRGLL